MTDTSTTTTSTADSNEGASVVAAALVEQNRLNRRRTNLLGGSLIVVLLVIVAALVAVAFQFRDFERDGDQRRDLIEQQGKVIARQANTIAELQAAASREAATVALIAEFVRQFAILVGPDEPVGTRAAARQRLAELADQADADAAAAQPQSIGPTPSPAVEPITTTTTTTTPAAVTTTSTTSTAPSTTTTLTTTTTTAPGVLEPATDLVCRTLAALCRPTLARWQIPQHPQQSPPCRQAPYAVSSGRWPSWRSAVSPPCSRPPVSSRGSGWSRSYP